MNSTRTGISTSASSGNGAGVGSTRSRSERSDPERLARGAHLTRAVLSVPLALLLVGGAAAASELERSYRFDIEAGSLSRALRSYGRTSGQQIIFTEALVEGRTRPALKGEFTSAAALDRLLEGTGLTAERAPSGALMIRAKSTRAYGNARSELLPWRCRMARPAGRPTCRPSGWQAPKGRRRHRMPLVQRAQPRLARSTKRGPRSGRWW